MKSTTDDGLSAVIDLDSSESLDPLLMLSSTAVEAICEEAAIGETGYKRKLRKRTAAVIVGNVIKNWRRGQVTRISLRRQSFSSAPWYGRPHYTYRLVTSVLRELEEAGFIARKIGFHNKDNSKRRRATRILPTAKLLDVVGEDASLVVLPDTRPLVLRKKIPNEDEQVDVTYEVTDPVKAMLGRLTSYNKLASRSKVVLERIDALVGERVRRGDRDQDPSTGPTRPPYQDQGVVLSLLGTFGKPSEIPAILPLRRASPTRLDVRLHRVFNEDWQHGGRHYMRGASALQSLPPDDRTLVYIKGQWTVELDYKALHPRMLYHMEGIDYPGDPYAAVDPNPAARPIVKRAMLVALNAASRRAAAGALRDDTEGAGADPELSMSLQDAGCGRPELLDRVVAAHEPIAGSFFTGIGRTLQYLDSLIASDIIDHFCQRSILVVPVHDSFIIDARHEAELRQVMLATYRKHMGFPCPVEQKKEKPKMLGDVVRQSTLLYGPLGAGMSLSQCLQYVEAEEPSLAACWLH